MKRATETGNERNESMSHILLLTLLVLLLLLPFFVQNNFTSNMHSAWLVCQFQMTYIFDGIQKWNIISMNIDALGWHSNHYHVRFSNENNNQN